MQTSEIALMELNDEDLLLVSGGQAFVEIAGPTRTGGATGLGARTEVSATGVITSTVVSGTTFGIVGGNIRIGPFG